MSNAFFNQVEIQQVDRWNHGPLELVFVKDPNQLATGRLEATYAIHEWNQSQSGGFVRSGEAIELLKPLLPALERKANPNLVIAPQTANGISQLDVMLASLLPDEALSKAGIKPTSPRF
jgi:hypothetical protein